MADADRALLKLTQDVEDVASGLHRFRDELPRSATRITTVISELFAISSVLRQIYQAHGDGQYAPSFYRIRDDLGLVFPSIGGTLDAVFDMFARSSRRPTEMVWDDLGYRMEQEESVGLMDRLGWYHSFLYAQLGVLTGRQPQDLVQLRLDLAQLLEAQEITARRAQRRSIDVSAASTPRPHFQRPRPTRLETPRSPTSLSDEWTDYRGAVPPPLVPDPPLGSPTFTSSTSTTLSSSQTSYSGEEGLIQRQVAQTALVHWAQQVFDGSNPATQFRPGYQLMENSACYGTADAGSLHHLVQDGFIRALELSFDRDQLWVRLYWRPTDQRARILIMTKDSNRRDVYFCTPLTNLKVIRERSCLQLCRAGHGGTYSLWARLNFFLYERMVLFYCTFVAMKRQDSRPVPHDSLMDSFELEHHGEEKEFSGMIRHGNLCHALRLFRDRASGVVRIEATAHRGRMQNVPLWTAFITKYSHDPDWANLEGRGVVSFAAIRPEPYVFHDQYEPPKNRTGEYILQFTSVEDAQFFMENWARICRFRG